MTTTLFWCLSVTSVCNSPAQLWNFTLITCVNPETLFSKLFWFVQPGWRTLPDKIRVSEQAKALNVIWGDKSCPDMPDAFDAVKVEMLFWNDSSLCVGAATVWWWCHLLVEQCGCWKRAQCWHQDTFSHIKFQLGFAQRRMKKIWD